MSLTVWAASKGALESGKCFLGVRYFDELNICRAHNY